MASLTPSCNRWTRTTSQETSALSKSQQCGMPSGRQAVCASPAADQPCLFPVLCGRIADPEAAKPEDWDEDAPRQVEDEDAEKPEGWLVDEAAEVEDPGARAACLKPLVLGVLLTAAGAGVQPTGDTSGFECAFEDAPD